MKDIGQRIRSRREKLGWTVQKLATLAGVDNGFLSKVETGKAGASWETYTKLAGALGVTVDVLFSSGNVVFTAPDWRRIPLLSYAEARQWPALQGSAREMDTTTSISTNLEYPADVFALRLTGNSMEPEFHEGEIVIISPSDKPRPGDFVMAVVDNEVTFNQYRLGGLNERGESVFELHPLNILYAHMRSDRQRISIIGTMIEHRRFRRP